MSIKSTYRVWLSAVGFVLILAMFGHADGNRRPNVVFILADDLGWTDTGAYGSKYYETPHIDQLAKQGVKLTSYHNCQNCQPTRAALLSGQYGPRTGVYTVGGIDRFDWSSRPLRPVDNVVKLPLDKITIAQRLKSAGYATGMFGKWHLGDDKEHHPSARGFDEAIVSAGKHFDFDTNPKTDYPTGTYLADFLTDKATEFIRRHRDQPFFLYVPHFGVHSPHQAKPELIEHFKKKAAVGGHRNPVYAAMIASVDQSVGRIVSLLDELKLTQDTIVIFSSDNGGVGGYVREGIKEEGDVTDNSPLRSGKGSLYEGGTRDPMIVRWPNHLAPGTTNNTPAIHVDMYPTLLEMCQVKVNDDYVLDGESLVRILKNPTDKLQREAIYQHFPGYLGAGKDNWRTTPVGIIQAGSWKLMEFFEDGRLELYNLESDLGESTNLAKTHPEKTAELHQKLIAWRKQVSAPMPTKNVGSTSEPAKKAKAKKRNKEDDNSR
jgi:arylsulfatase A-like enzyme